jgi:hypothetical protein
LIALFGAHAGQIASLPAPVTPNSLLTMAWVGGTWFETGVAGSDVLQAFGAEVTGVGPTTWAGDANSGTGIALASLQYGLIHLYSSVVRVGSSSRTDLPDYRFRAYAYGRFTDTITIDAPGRTGETGMTTFDLMVTAAAVESGSGVTTMAHALIWVKEIGAAGYAYSGNVETQLIDTTAPISFTYGVPFSFYMAVGANATLYGVAEGSDEVNMLNSAALSGVNVFDGQGNPVTDYTLTAASGFSYAPAVPEPATAWIGGLGLAWLAAVLKRKVR